MISESIVLAAALTYGAFLFTIAWAADRAALRGRGRWLRSPLVYTLSLSIYCTAWTFYGAVGLAAHGGLDYLTIYLGPTLVMLAWWGLLRKLLRVGRRQRTTSIADLISSRYGKSAALGGMVTVLVLLGTTPYIALQLQSVTLSLAVFAEAGAGGTSSGQLYATAFYVAVGLAVFSVLFGTRNLDANEQHHGVVIAVAAEAIVKLIALVAVGIFVVWTLGGGPVATLREINASSLGQFDPVPSRWIGLTFAAAAAFLCLPRIFHVLVVENADERHLTTAAWAFPAYMLGMSLFVLPIAVIGLRLMPDSANPDLFVLTLPLEHGLGGLAMLSFLGGFSSATSMVVVATIALATMVSNHIVLPIWLRMISPRATMSGDIRQVVLMARRVSIALVLSLGYFYFRLSGGGAPLASIGLIAFCGVAQILPAMLGGLFWHGATRRGALLGVSAGFAIWLWTLFLPSFGGAGLFPESLLNEGPFGISWLRPQAMMGLSGLDPVVHTFFWSLTINLLCFVLGSVFSFPTPVEYVQAVDFVNVFEHNPQRAGPIEGRGQASDLLLMSQRILGATEAQALFSAEATRQGRAPQEPIVTTDFLLRLERRLAGSVGAATAHAMVGQLSDGPGISVEELMAAADEAAEILEYSNRLEAKSAELAETARALRLANSKLTALGVQKDAFLSQVGHELRTPMASIRSFSDILCQGGLTQPERRRFAGIIRDEAERLTRLLDDLLDLSVLENGQVTLHMRAVRLSDILDRALLATNAQASRLRVTRQGQALSSLVVTDVDRLSQVFINVISNTIKYCDAEQPELTISLWEKETEIGVDFVDNGSGIPLAQQQLIFEKFARLHDDGKAGSAGLGLAICREIMQRLGGAITYLPSEKGAAFRVTLPLNDAQSLSQPS